MEEESTDDDKREESALVNEIRARNIRIGHSFGNVIRRPEFRVFFGMFIAPLIVVLVVVSDVVSDSGDDDEEVEGGLSLDFIAVELEASLLRSGCER